MTFPPKIIVLSRKQEINKEEIHMHKLITARVKRSGDQIYCTVACKLDKPQIAFKKNASSTRTDYVYSNLEDCEFFYPCEIESQ